METRKLKSQERQKADGPPKGSPLSSGKILEGRYEIDQKMGAGGVGDVYRAKHLRLNRAVAVKVLQPGYAASKKLRLRFEREAHALAMMAHPNVVTINDFGLANDMPFLVMELLEGEPLSERLKRGRLETATAIEVTRQVLRALAFAHGQGWVHRDLKPGNIFLQQLAGGATHVKILDFGLAKMVTNEGERKGPKLTLTGMVFGTPAYMSPEQAVGSDTDARTDIYSLGVVFFEMLAGRRLFLGDADKLMRQHLQGPIPLVSDACPEIGPTADLDRALSFFLAKERGDRYQTSEEALEALAAITRFERAHQDALSTADVDATGKTALDIGGKRRPAPTPTTEMPTKQDSPSSKEEQRGSEKPVRSEGESRPPLLPLSAVAGLVLGIALAVPVTCAVVGGSSGSDSTDPSAPPAPGVPSPQDTRVEPVKSAEIPTRPEKVAQKVAPPPPSEPPPQSKTSIGANSPWSSDDMPHIITEARNQLATGKQLSRGMRTQLRRYAFQHRTEDSRPFLLLARNCIKRGAMTDAVDRYERAYSADNAARQDPQMLADLVKLVESRSVGNRASRAVKTIYGKQALPVVEQSLRSPDLASKARRRLAVLRDELRAMPGT